MLSALELLARTVIGGVVAVESHGLPFHRHALERGGARVVPVRIDADGMVIDELERTGATAVVLTPSHQFPTGVALSPARRMQVVDWARRTGAVIVEDDYDGEFRYDRQPVGSVQGLDPDRVIYLGSISKSLSPVLRLGWMVLPADLVEPMPEPDVAVVTPAYNEADNIPLLIERLHAALEFTGRTGFES